MLARARCSNITCGNRGCPPCNSRAIVFRGRMAGNVINIPPSTLMVLSRACSARLPFPRFLRHTFRGVYQLLEQDESVAN